MSEIDTRPAPSRGRSSVRGGRGGFGRGGPRGGHRPTNGASTYQQEPSLDDQGELGNMKKQYSSQLPMLKDMFPDWTDVDLVFALQETDGDLPLTIERITEGHVSQFSEIKKPKDRARSKAKDGLQADLASSAPRGGRGRGGFESSRGGRGRGDRGRAVSRGGRAGLTKPQESHTDTVTSTIPEANAWGAPAVDNTPAEPANESSWGNVVTSDSVPKTASEGAKQSLLPEGPAKKTWASMFSQPKPPPAPVAAPAPQIAPSPPVPVEEEQPAAPIPEPTPAEPEVPAVPEAQEEKPAELEAEQPVAVTEPIEPPHDALTEDNLENLPDTSIPPATQTVASNAGSDARQAPAQQQPITRPGPGVGGYASTAMRATGFTPRSASFQRRVAEQQEAVVLPGHNSVDRAAVQFGSMGLNGDGADVDEEREEPETRTQPPQQSPPGQPRAALPPAPLQASAPAQDSFTAPSMPTPKQAPGLPPANPQHAQAAQSGGQDAVSTLSQQSQPPYSQYGRYGQPDASTASQKSYDPFSHQTPSAFDQFSSQSQTPSQQPQTQQPQSQQGQQGQQTQHGQQSGYGGYSAAPSDYSQYYTSEQQRQAYQNYYGSSYGQQQSQSQQDPSNAQQRAGSSLGSGQGESAYGASQSTQQGRYNDTQGSGHNTPNPLLSGQQQSTGPQQAQQQQQQQQHSGYGSGFPYGHPYYTGSPFPTAYQNQFGGYGGYGGGPYGQKAGMYGQHHGYGMNAPSSYDHSSSPANSGFNQQSSLHSRDSGLGGSGAGDYGRSSAQPSSMGSGGFGGFSDYSRSGSNYQGHGYGSQQAGASEDIKSYGDSKSNPTAANTQPGRPGSAANSSAGQGQNQSGLPPPQSHQQGFGGYPGFNQSSQYGGGGLGGLSGHQQGGHQAGGQGGYGGYGGFSQNYSQYGRGGWGASYGQH